MVDRHLCWLCALFAVFLWSAKSRAGEPGARIRAVPIDGSAQTTTNAGETYDPYTKQQIRKWLEELTSRDALTRAAAADGLGPLKVPDAVRPLIALVQQDPDSSVRASAAEALGKIGDNKAVDALIEAMRLPALDIRAEIVAPAAARALGHIGDAAAVPALTQALQRAGDLQFAAREALEMIDAPSARAAVVAQDARIAREYISRLNDKTASTRAEACRELGSMRARSGVNPVLKMLNDEDAQVRSAAAGALGEIGDPAAVGQLVALLADKGSAVRIAGAEALAALPQPSTIPPTAGVSVLAGLEDKEVRVRTASAAVLGKWRVASAIPSLVKALENPAERIEVRVAACGALARFNDPVASEALNTALTKGLPAVREEAALQYGHVGDRRGLQELLTLIRNTKANPNRQIQAIELLAKFREPSSIPALSLASRNENAEVREAAARALVAVRSAPTTSATR